MQSNAFAPNHFAVQSWLHVYLIGAINVLRAGHARLACEVNGDVGRQQQEPTDVAA